MQDIATALGVTIGTIFGFSNPETRDRYEDRVKEFSEFHKEIGIDDTEAHFKEEEENSIPSLSKKGVPYYDVDFYGGFDFAFNDQTIQPAFLIDYAPTMIVMPGSMFQVNQCPLYIPWRYCSA